VAWSEVAVPLSPVRHLFGGNDLLRDRVTACLWRGRGAGPLLKVPAAKSSGPGSAGGSVPGGSARGSRAATQARGAGFAAPPLSAVGVPHVPGGFWGCCCFCHRVLMRLHVVILSVAVRAFLPVCAPTFSGSSLKGGACAASVRQRLRRRSGARVESDSTEWFLTPCERRRCSCPHGGGGGIESLAADSPSQPRSALA